MIIVLPRRQVIGDWRSYPRSIVYIFVVLVIHAYVLMLGLDIGDQNEIVIWVKGSPPYTVFLYVIIVGDT